MESDIAKIVEEIVKHLPSRHDQGTHAGKNRSATAKIRPDPFKSPDKKVRDAAKKLVIGSQKGLRASGWSSREIWNKTPRDERISALTDQGFNFGYMTGSFEGDEEASTLTQFFAFNMSGGNDKAKVFAEDGTMNQPYLDDSLDMLYDFISDNVYPAR